MWLQRSTVAVISASYLHFLPKLIKSLWRKGRVSNIGNVALWQTQQTRVLLNLTLLCLWSFPWKVAVKTDLQIDNKDLSMSHGDLSTASSLVARAEVVASDSPLNSDPHSGLISCKSTKDSSFLFLWATWRFLKKSPCEQANCPEPNSNKQVFGPIMTAATLWPLLVWATLISCPKQPSTHSQRRNWHSSCYYHELQHKPPCGHGGQQNCPNPRSNETNNNVNPEIFWTQCGCGDTVAIISASYLHFLPKIDMKRVSFFLGTGARVGKMSEICCFDFLKYFSV